MLIPPLSKLSPQTDLVLFWFRRDLRLADNHGLYQALKAHANVLPFFIFDTHILEKLDDPCDRRVQFIYNQLQQLHVSLEKLGSTLLVCHGRPVAVCQYLLRHISFQAVYTNHDYEPYARARDHEVAACLASHHIALHSFKDQVLFEKGEVMKDNAAPYTVFTPYMKKWKMLFQPAMARAFASDSLAGRFLKTEPLSLPTLRDIGFQSAQVEFPSKTIDLKRIRKYEQQRDIPSVLGTSRLSTHLRHGTISIRSAMAVAYQYNAVWMNELIWREFYMMILWHFPHVAVRAFKPAYDQIAWENNPSHFQAWCEGKTGYPIVDAGMRELNTTGYMHNRLRMITASFLTKHLLIDWRWGEAYFAKKLLDFELSSNNGGWQWASGSGCDAAPYFRVFNPYLQTQKFDPALAYTKRWVPEMEDATYPTPIVVHSAARARALAAYKSALQSKRKEL